MREFRPVPKPVKQEKPVNKRIKPRSTKRVKQEREYAKLRIEYLEAHPLCEGQLTGCTGIASEVHHKFSGSKRNSHFLDVLTWMSVCRNCHNDIHNNPKKAKELRFLM